MQQKAIFFYKQTLQLYEEIYYILEIQYNLDYIYFRGLSSASAEDIWSVLDKATNGSSLPGNLSEILNNWLKEPGYPLVTVEEDGNKIIISQVNI